MQRGGVCVAHGLRPASCSFSAAGPWAPEQPQLKHLITGVDLDTGRPLVLKILRRHETAYQQASEAEEWAVQQLGLHAPTVPFAQAEVGAGGGGLLRSHVEIKARMHCMHTLHYQHMAGVGVSFHAKAPTADACAAAAGDRTLARWRPSGDAGHWGSQGPQDAMVPM